MAIRVPRASDTRVKKTAPGAPRLSTDAPLEAFGGGASAAAKSEATRGLASDVSKLILQERKKADDAQFNEKSGELGQLEIQLGKERDKNRGKDALGYPEKENEARDQGQQKILSSITNRRVKRRLQSEAISFSLSGQKATQNHVSAEIDKYDRNSLKASVENNRIVALNSGDDKAIQNSITVNENRIKEYGKSHGLSDDEIDLSTFNATSETHAQNIGRLIQIDTNAAKEYYDVHKKEINQKSLSEADLDKKIKAYEKVNVSEIEDSLNDDLLNDSLTPEKVLSVSQEASLGGIGSKKALSYLKKLKQIQDGKIKVILDDDDSSKEYVKLVDRLISSAKDNFEFKQILVDSWADGFLNEKEKNDLRGLSDKFVELEKQANPNWFWNPIRAFQNFHGTAGEAKRDQSTVTSLKSLIHRIGSGDDPQEAVQEVNKADVVERHPQRAGYEIGKVYTEAGIKFKFNGFLSVDDMDIEVVE